MNNGLLAQPRGRRPQLFGFSRGNRPDASVYPIISPGVLTNRGSVDTTHPVNLPLGLTYGDFVVGVAYCDSAPTAITYPDASWVEMNNVSTQTVVYFYRLCDGGPIDRLGTLDLTLTAGARLTAITWRVRGAERQAPIFSGISTNSSTPMNPPSVNLVSTTGIQQTAREALVLVLGRLTSSPPGLIAGYSVYEMSKLAPDDLSSGILVLGCWKTVKGVSEDPPPHGGGNASSFSVMTVAFLAARSKAAGI